jgi:DNA-directed RNA polymerase subunit RPC12/RpoP
MEDDESKTAPAQQILHQPQVEMMQQQMEEMKKIMIQNQADKTNAVAIIVGAFLIIYALFRMWVTLSFLPFFAEGGTGFSIIFAFVICGVLIYSAILILRNYRVGSYLALGVLTISGGLSILLHDADFNPLSLGFGGWVPVSWSVFCSGSCILIALLPLLDQSMKSELPPEFEGAFGLNAVTETSTNRFVCTNCRSDLEVPKSYTGRIQCPKCNSEMEV